MVEGVVRGSRREKAIGTGIVGRDWGDGAERAGRRRWPGRRERSGCPRSSPKESREVERRSLSRQPALSPVEWASVVRAGLCSTSRENAAQDAHSQVSPPFVHLSTNRLTRPSCSQSPRASEMPPRTHPQRWTRGPRSQSRFCWPRDRTLSCTERGRSKACSCLASRCVAHPLSTVSLSAGTAPLLPTPRLGRVAVGPLQLRRLRNPSPTAFRRPRQPLPSEPVTFPISPDQPLPLHPRPLLLTPKTAENSTRSSPRTQAQARTRPRVCRKSSGACCRRGRPRAQGV